MAELPAILDQVEASIEDFARFRCRSPRTIRRWIKSGAVPAVRDVGSRQWKVLIQKWILVYNASQHVPQPTKEQTIAQDAEPQTPAAEPEADPYEKLGRLGEMLKRGVKPKETPKDEVKA